MSQEESRHSLVHYTTMDPTTRMMDSKPVILPALTTLLYKVCDGDHTKFEEALRLVDLFIDKALEQRPPTVIRQDEDPIYRLRPGSAVIALDKFTEIWIGNDNGLYVSTVVGGEIRKSVSLGTASMRVLQGLIEATHRLKVHAVDGEKG